MKINHNPHLKLYVNGGASATQKHEYEREDILPGRRIMRAFIPGDKLCDDGDGVPRVEEIEGCLETRDACSRVREGVNEGFMHVGRRLKGVS